jgi:hypothetical protein
MEPVIEFDLGGMNVWSLIDVERSINAINEAVRSTVKFATTNEPEELDPNLAQYLQGYNERCEKLRREMRESDFGMSFDDDVRRAVRTTQLSQIEREYTNPSKAQGHDDAARAFVSNFGGRLLEDRGVDVANQTGNVISSSYRVLGSQTEG